MTTVLPAVDLVLSDLCQATWPDLHAGLARALLGALAQAILRILLHGGPQRCEPASSRLRAWADCFGWPPAEVGSRCSVPQVVHCRGQRPAAGRCEAVACSACCQVTQRRDHPWDGCCRPGPGGRAVPLGRRRTAKAGHPSGHVTPVWPAGCNEPGHQHAHRQVSGASAGFCALAALSCISSFGRAVHRRCLLLAHLDGAVACRLSLQTQTRWARGRCCSACWRTGLTARRQSG